MSLNSASLGYVKTSVGRDILDAIGNCAVLNKERTTAYGSLVCLFYAVIVFFLWRRGIWPIGADGFPVQMDFVSFWAAGLLTINGEAAEIYNAIAHKNAQIEAIGRDFAGHYYWLYPPMFLFVTALLALLPYMMAWIIWIVLSLSVFIASLRLIVAVPGIIIGAVAAPTTLFCAMTGQNGLLTAGLMAGTLALLDRHPWLSGVLLGLLTYKPHYGLLFPVVLLVTRRWEVFLAAAATASVVAGASALTFGTEVWAAFFDSMSFSVNDFLRNGGADWAKLQSFYAFSRQVTGDDGMSWAVHLSMSLAVAAAVILIWVRDTTLAVKAAALIAASYLMTPYAYIYDAVVLTVGTVFLLKDGVERGFRSFDKVLLCLCQCLPGLFFVGALHSLIAPVAALLLLGLALRRSVSWSTRHDVPLVPAGSGLNGLAVGDGGATRAATLP